MFQNSSASRATFGQAQVSGHVSEARRPVFVGGCPRSGTTLLRSMLNSHPELAMPHETYFVVPAWRRRDAFGDLTVERERRAVAQWIVETPKTRYPRLSLTEDELSDALAAAPPTIGSLIAAAFAASAAKQGKPRWGDKRPHYILNMNAVYGLFPNAQFVNIIRDPRGAISSMKRIGWSWGGLPSATEMWTRSVESADTWRRRLGPDQFMNIYYEDLVTNPEVVVAQLISFLGLDPAGTDAMLHHHEAKDIPTGTPFTEVAKPVNTDAMRTWEKELTAEDLAFVDHVAGSLISKHGYEFAAPAGAQPDKEKLRKLRKIRSRRLGESRKRQAVELKRKFTYRVPAASRLHLPND
ncbi:sulfotransferase [Actinocorallia sp. A-T 12471]|uniref:sulfotransferase family protein n=1 Tax=Actinocorallia sp. A-T 12471 TaxID=3089813 RepID=UPI0029D3C302|nr:sulfotransferase [Actinocorallia sp. A-T 12471]MDX6743374.1 sulfotransferase [Actinocorallia sp. A-T 12471]